MLATAASALPQQPSRTSPPVDACKKSRSMDSKPSSKLVSFMIIGLCNSWRRWRWGLFTIGTLFAIVLANYWIADEIYSYVPYVR